MSSREKREKLIQYVKSAILAIALVAGLSFIQAWSGPPAGTPPACPSGSVGCDAPINVSNTAQTKTGDLTIDNAANTSLLKADNLIVNFYTTFSDNVGIGMSPTVSGPKLQVAGSIGLSDYAVPCVAGIAGAVRYNSTDKAVQFCDGVSWANLAGGGGYTGPLVSGGKTGAQCASAGGVAVPIGAGGTAPYVCKFTMSSCLSGWSPYNNWSTTGNNTCIGYHAAPEGGTLDPSQCSNPAYHLWSCLPAGGTNCSTGFHTFSNVAVESCSYTVRVGGACNALGTGQCDFWADQPNTCTASKTQIGCI